MKTMLVPVRKVETGEWTPVLSILAGEDYDFLEDDDTLQTVKGVCGGKAVDVFVEAVDGVWGYVRANDLSENA